MPFSCFPTFLLGSDWSLLTRLHHIIHAFIAISWFKVKLILTIAFILCSVTIHHIIHIN